MLISLLPQRSRIAGSVCLIAFAVCLTVPMLGQGRQLSPALAPYLSCRSVAGAALVQTTPLIAAPSKRSVQTLQGDRLLDVADGARLNYTLNGADYAYMRVEELPFETYLQGRADLISNFKRLVSGDEFAFPEEAPATLHGIEVVGSNHHVMLGDALGLYLLLDARTHVAVTIYFQNADLAHHSFSNMEQYARLRDAFLSGYTACVRTSQQHP